MTKLDKLTMDERIVLTNRIVDALAAHDIHPDTYTLGDYVHSDLLDSVVAYQDHTTTVRFTVHHHTVTVYGTGDVEVTQPR